MPLSIQTIKPADINLWQSMCESCDYATFFHTPLWAGIFTEYTAGKCRPAPELVVFSDDRRAIIPFTIQTNVPRMMRTYLSSPAGTYGGWIADNTLTQEHLNLLAAHILDRANLYWRENPFDTPPAGIQIDKCETEYTSVVDLSGGEREIVAAQTYAHKKAMHKALRSNVVIQEATGTGQWKRHYKAYKASQARWEKAGKKTGSGVPYSWRLFDIIRQKAPSNAKLWFASVDGKFAAGALCFYWNRHAVAWHGAGHEEFFDLRPNNLLYHEMILDAFKKGYKWFDCNPSNGLEGVARFKDMLGAKRIEHRVVVRSSVWKRMLKRMVR